MEERRWLFQQQNPDWYVPDPKPQSNWSLQVKLHPVCYAPLKPSKTRKPEPHIVHHAAECQCGKTRFGFGTECLHEKMVNVSNSSTRCFFLRNVSDELHIPQKASSLSTGLGMVLWLQNANVSGKFARLRLENMTEQDQDAGQRTREWHFNCTANSEFLGCIWIPCPAI